MQHKIYGFSFAPWAGAMVGTATTVSAKDQAKASLDQFADAQSVMLTAWIRTALLEGIKGDPRLAGLAPLNTGSGWIEDCVDSAIAVAVAPLAEAIARMED